MSKKLWYTWSDIELMCQSLVNQMYNDNWRPELIVGITRGGNIPATIISNMLDINCDTLQVNFRDNGLLTETNCVLAEDAFGYNDEKRKNILIIDDINDTGKTFQWIMKDWESSCLPNSHTWKEVWDNNVRFAVLTENLASNFEMVKYHASEVNKAENDMWLVYPWENIGQYDK
jgi:uncharacterized protein